MNSTLFGLLTTCEYMQIIQKVAVYIWSTENKYSRPHSGHAMAMTMCWRRPYSMNLRPCAWSWQLFFVCVGDSTCIKNPQILQQPLFSCTSKKKEPVPWQCLKTHPSNKPIAVIEWENRGFGLGSFVFILVHCIKPVSVKLHTGTTLTCIQHVNIVPISVWWAQSYPSK